MTLSLMLAGCDAFMARPEPVAPPPAPPANEARPDPDAGQPTRPVPRPTRKPAAAAQPAPQPEPLRPPSVIGLNREGLRHHFGSPVQEREAAPARVLEFGGGDCRLVVYLYFDTARNDFYALQYEVNGAVPNHAAPNGGATDQCLARIARDAERR